LVKGGISREAWQPFCYEKTVANGGKTKKVAEREPKKQEIGVWNFPVEGRERNTNMTTTLNDSPRPLKEPKFQCTGPNRENASSEIG